MFETENLWIIFQTSLEEYYNQVPIVIVRLK